MPTAWEPCPGNISASFVMTSSGRIGVDAARSQLPLGEAGAPGEPSAEPGHQQHVALLQAAVLTGLVQADRNRGARGVAIAVQVGEHLRLSEPQTPRRGLD